MPEYPAANWEDKQIRLTRSGRVLNMGEGLGHSEKVVRAFTRPFYEKLEPLQIDNAYAKHTGQSSIGAPVLYFDYLTELRRFATHWNLVEYSEVVSVDGVTLERNEAYTINYTTGEVRFKKPPAGPVILNSNSVEPK